MSLRRQVGQTPNMRISTSCRHRRVWGKVGTGFFFKPPPLQQQKDVGQAHQGDVVMPALSWQNRTWRRSLRRRITYPTTQFY
jgi:hypothetical protein